VENEIVFRATIGNGGRPRFQVNFGIGSRLE